MRASACAIARHPLWTGASIEAAKGVLFFASVLREQGILSHKRWCFLRFGALSSAGFFNDKNGTERAMKYHVRAAAVKSTF